MVMVLAGSVIMGVRHRSGGIVGSGTRGVVDVPCLIITLGGVGVQVIGSIW